jgi:hypothetical protein
MEYFKALSIRGSYANGWWLINKLKHMKNCAKCGQNNWKWKCEQGMITGYCQGCGEKTNTFKARKGQEKKKESEHHKHYGI